MNSPDAPVAQLDRVSPSEGEGHRFESCRVRQPFCIDFCEHSLRVSPIAVPRQGVRLKGRRPAMRRRHDRYFAGITLVPVGPMPVTWTITSPSLAQTKCGVSLGSEKKVPVG